MNRSKLFMFAIFLAFGASLYAQNNNSKFEDANNLLKEKKYKEAVIAYNDILKTDENNTMAWYYLGSAEYNLKNYDKAITAYQKAMKGLRGPIARYNIACAYALKGNKEMALKYLQEAANKGFGLYQKMTSDNDLDAIRNEKKFNEILEKVKINGNPCLARPEYRQFNFWIGNWNVTTPTGQHAGDSEIDLMNNGCTIIENWYGANGFEGKSFDYFDTTDNNWHQFWINQNAKKTTFEGKLENGNMVFYSYDHVKDKNNPFLRRLIFYNLGPDKVRQYSEKSTDNGKTWNVEYDLTYLRKTNSN